MRNPPFDPNAVLIEDQRTARAKRGLDYASRYEDALIRYLNRSADKMDDPIATDFWTKWNLERLKAKSLDQQAAESRAKYGEFPTIRTAGEHIRTLPPIMRKLLGL